MMSLLSAKSSASDAALSEHVRRRRKHPRHAFIAWFEAHPALEVACPDSEFVAELYAHPLYCLASRCSVQHWEVVLSRRAPSQVHEDQWNVYGINVGLKQRTTLLVRAALCKALVQKLMRFRSAGRARHLLRLAKCVLSRRHFLGRKNQAVCLFQEGQRLYQQERYSDAARSWGQAALLQHGASHAFLSDMMYDGRPDVGRDGEKAMELAAAGAATGCAHSKGVLARWHIRCLPDDENAAKGFLLGSESAAAGSCFGQFVLGSCYLDGIGVARDDAEALRFLGLSAAQGNASAQHKLAGLFDLGWAPPTFARDDAEAERLWRLAASQGHADAQFCLAENLRGYRFGQVEKDREEAWRYYGLAAAQGHSAATARLKELSERRL
jgi:TPR repeat protein